MNSRRRRHSALFAREGDTGVQHERTSLAWVRTSMAFAIVGGLLLRGAQQMGLPAVGYALGIAILAVAAAAVSVQRTRYYRREAYLREGLPVARPQALRVVAFAAIATCLAAVAGVVLLLA